MKRALFDILPSMHGFISAQIDNVVILESLYRIQIFFYQMPLKVKMLQKSKLYSLFIRCLRLLLHKYISKYLDKLDYFEKGS